MGRNIQELLLLLVTYQLAGLCLSENHIVLETLDCSCQAPICGNSTCHVVKLDALRSNITVGGMFVKKVKFIKFRVRRWIQNPGKKWSSADLNFSIDYCDFVKGANNPVINLLAPGIRQVLGDALRPCPVQGWFLIKYTSEPGKGTTQPFGQLVKSEVMLVTINSQMFFKVTLLSKVQ